jgi:hypothetical protein
VDDLDIVAGIIEQVAGLGSFGREMRRDQRKIPGAEPPQQIVEWPFDAAGSVFASRCHPEVPLASQSRQ